MNLFAACDMPAIIHINTTTEKSYGICDELGLPRLEKVLKAYPNLKLIGHSAVFWAEISGDITEETRNGYPTGKVQPGGRITELMHKYPNLYCDLSAASGHNAIMRDPEFGMAFGRNSRTGLFTAAILAAPPIPIPLRLRHLWKKCWMPEWQVKKFTARYSVRMSSAS